MIKCYKCDQHTKRGYVHSCAKCPTKQVYGELQEPFIANCSYYRINNSAELAALDEQRRKLAAKIAIYESGRTHEQHSAAAANDELYALDQKARRLRREANE